MYVSGLPCVTVTDRQLTPLGAGTRREDRRPGLEERGAQFAEQNVLHEREEAEQLLRLRGDVIADPRLFPDRDDYVVCSERFFVFWLFDLATVYTPVYPLTYRAIVNIHSMSLCCLA